jgi:hypothetical protein
MLLSASFKTLILTIVTYLFLLDLLLLLLPPPANGCRDALLLLCLKEITN